MHRVPQSFMVNWNGLPPHLEDTRAPVLKSYLKNYPNFRDRFHGESNHKDQK